MIYTHLGAVLAGLAIGAAGGWQVQAWRHGRIAAEAQAHVATAREEAMHGALIETTRRLTAQQEAAHAAETKARRARADAVAAGAAADSLREYATQLAADASACGATAPGDGPADRLANVLGESVEQYREVAAAADRAVIAGQLCQQSYDALTNR